MDGGVRQIYIKDTPKTTRKRNPKKKNPENHVLTKKGGGCGTEMCGMQGGMQVAEVAQVAPVTQVAQVTKVAQLMKGGTHGLQGMGSANPSTWLTYPGNLVPPAINPQQGGTKDTKHIKVELKKRTTPKRVHLNQKKPVASKKQTKRIRKITLGVSTFHKRITRAKKLHRKVKELPLDKLKEKLIKSGLIKSTSKAPESILRQIASDSEVVSKKAL